jgi:hypothetical protein
MIGRARIAAAGGSDPARSTRRAPGGAIARLVLTRTRTAAGRPHLRLAGYAAPARAR